MRHCPSNMCRLFARILFIALLVLPTAVLAAEKPGKVPQTAPAPQSGDMSDQMAVYMKYANPGPEHQVLQAMAGSWKTVTKAWMGPGDPVSTEGHCKTSVILGGRFITDEFKGTFMEKPFEGFGLLGYDLLKKEYVSAWTDSMGTAIMMSRGSMDPAGKVLTMFGTYDDPVTGQKQTMREVTRFLDNNTHVFEIYGNHNGQEVKEMEITYTRQ